MLKNGRRDVHAVGTVEELINQQPDGCRSNAAPDAFGFGAAIAKYAEQRIHQHSHSHQVDDVECHGLYAGRDGIDKFVGKVGQCQTVLVECHPEKDDHGKHQAERHNAFFGLLGTEFGHFGAGGSLLFHGAFHMLEPRTARVVNRYRKNQRCARHGKSKVVRVVDTCAERRLRPIHNFDGCRRSKHGADVDGHVEERKCGIAAIGILRVVVQIAHHHLQIAFEQACAQRDEQQRRNHENHRHDDAAIVDAAHGNSQQHITQKHNENADGYTFTVTDFVGKNATDQRQEID